MRDVRERIDALGLQLPTPPTPVASYVPAVRSGDLVFTAGQIPVRDGRLECRGPVPSSVSVDEAREAAALCALNAIAVVGGVLDGDLDRIRRIVRVAVFVSCDPGFTEQSIVANGASDLLEQIFGDDGRHVRAAVGSIALPLGASVELEMVAETR